MSRWGEKVAKFPKATNSLSPHQKCTTRARPRSVAESAAGLMKSTRQHPSHLALSNHDVGARRSFVFTSSLCMWCHIYSGCFPIRRNGPPLASEMAEVMWAAVYGGAAALWGLHQALVVMHSKRHLREQDAPLPAYCPHVFLKDLGRLID